MKQERLALLVFHVCLIQGNINIPPIIIIIFETALKIPHLKSHENRQYQQIRSKTYLLECKLLKEIIPASLPAYIIQENRPSLCYCA